jgi:hypothetical protein
MTAGSVSLDIFELFGDTIESFRTRQNAVIELIWDSQIENEEYEEGEALDVKVLSRWLSSQDRVLASLNRDHSTFVDQQVVSRSSKSSTRGQKLISHVGVYLPLVPEAPLQVLPGPKQLLFGHWRTWGGKDHACRINCREIAATYEPEAVRHSVLLSLSGRSYNGDFSVSCKDSPVPAAGSSRW